MVIVGIAVEFVRGDVDLVGALDEVQVVDAKSNFAIAGDLRWLELFDGGVRAVAADAVGIEQPHAKHEVVRGLVHPRFEPHLHGLAGLKDVTDGAIAAVECDLGHLDLARTPSTLGRLEHIGWCVHDVGGLVAVCLTMGDAGHLRHLGLCQLRLLGVADVEEIRRHHPLGLTFRKRLSFVEPERTIAEPFDKVE
jgi:hypothetical protein